MMGFGDLLWLMLFALAGGLALVGSRRLFDQWFTPLSVFFGINCASLCAYHLRLLGLKNVSAITHLVVLTCLLAFALGTMLAVNRRPPPPEQVRQRIDVRGLSSFLHITGAIATVGWIIAAVIVVQRHGGFGLLLANLWMLQSEFQMQGIGYLNMIGILVLPAYVLKRSCGGASRLDLLLVVSALWGLMLAGIKAFVFYSALSALVTWSLARPDRFRPRHLALVVLVLLVFFVAYNSVVDIFVVPIVTGVSSWFAHVPQLHWPYIYFVGSWPAMQTIVDGKLPGPPVTGAMTLYAFWKVAGDFLGLVPSVPFAQSFVDIGATTFNVFSIFGVLYQEWTWAGAVVICGLLGFIATRLYLRARRAGHWGHVLVYSLFAYGLFMSCFMYSYRFNEAVLLLYIYVLGFVVLRGGVLVDRSGDE